MRWYAHNRGYDGNAAWVRGEEDKEDTKKVENAKELMRRFGTCTFAETVCQFLEIDIEQPVKKSSRKYFKGESVAFPRDIVVDEVRSILEKHLGVINGLDPVFIAATLEDKNADPSFTHGLPQRWNGGFLFGQKIPRFDNRIIPECPVSGRKKPLKHHPMYFRYRWMMLLGDIRVSDSISGESRPLGPDEITRIDAWGESMGRFTSGTFKQAVEAVTNCEAPQLDKRFLTEEMAWALEVDRVKATIIKAFGVVRKLPPPKATSDLWQVIPSPVRNCLFREAGRKGGPISLAEVGERARAFGVEPEDFRTTLAKTLKTLHPRPTKSTPTIEQVLDERILVKRETGRAPYAKPVMGLAVKQIGEGKDPRSTGNALHIPGERFSELANTPIDRLTNNHLVRHRLKIQLKLLEDIKKRYEVGGAQIDRVVVEVIRDLTEFSGLNAKEKESLLKNKTRHHNKVADWLTSQLRELRKESEYGASLIRKARIGDDLGWVCPYTGQLLDLKMLLDGQLQLDHIIPRTQRPSDSLDSLVLTFSEVNKMKGDRTALQFIREERSRPVRDREQLSIMPEDRYLKFVAGLRSPVATEDDRKRCKRRQQLFRTLHYDKRERGFSNADLTQTSYLNKLARAVIEQSFMDREREERPFVSSIPGGVTGAVRKSWKLNGTLAQAVPAVLNRTGDLSDNAKTKGEIREITHLHHALDAIIIGLADRWLPCDNDFRRVLISRRNKEETIDPRWKEFARFDKDGKAHLHDDLLPPKVKDSIISALNEKRVVYHQPRSMKGMNTEQTIWRVEGSLQNGKIAIRQRAEMETSKAGQKMPGEQRRRWKHDSEWPNKLLGYHPPTPGGKLAAVKGAVVIGENYGMALDPKPFIIPFHRVYEHAEELKKANHGEQPRIIRCGTVIRLTAGKKTGLWRVLSVKNTEAFGLALDLISPERIKTKGMKKADGFIGNAMIKTLLKSGLEIIDLDYCGYPKPK